MDHDWLLERLIDRVCSKLREKTMTIPSIKIPSQESKAEIVKELQPPQLQALKLVNESDSLQIPLDLEKKWQSQLDQEWGDVQRAHVSEAWIQAGGASNMSRVNR